jgi:ribosomal-protein-alanine N-acetyltransferase
MREDDIPAVLDIEHVSFSTKWSRQSFLNEMYNKYSFLKAALYEKNIIGYICADYLHHEARILNLAVHPDFRRRGVATMLLNDIKSELKNRGCVFLYLKVRESDAGARHFYERLGFEIETIRKRYYGNPDEDALQMMGRI